MTDVAIQLVESNGSGLTTAGAIVFVVVFALGFTALAAIIDYLGRFK